MSAHYLLIKKVADYSRTAEIEDFIAGFVEREIAGSLKGKRILLKPNLLMKKSPETAITTHPAVVGACARVLKKKGAELYLGDSPGGKNTRNSFIKLLKGCGLDEVINESGIKPVFFDDDFSEVNIGGETKARLAVANAARDYDLVFNLAKFKTHGFMGLTAAVKNNFGFVIGFAKAQCHLRFPDPLDFASMLVDLASYVSPQFNIVDGILSMDREGPSSGRVISTGFLAASTSPFLIDYELLKRTSIEQSRVYTVTVSQKRGLIPSDYAVDGDKDLVMKEFEPPKKTSLLGEKPVFRWARNQLTAIPYYDRSLCRKCYRCVESCPPQVIRKDSEGFPYLADKQSCIRCYCCVELCPYKAAKLRYPWLLRLFM